MPSTPADLAHRWNANVLSVLNILQVLDAGLRYFYQVPVSRAGCATEEHPDPVLLQAARCCTAALRLCSLIMVKPADLSTA